MKKSENLYIQRFGIKLKMLRTKRGMTRNEFTEKTGFSKSFVAKIEDGLILSPSKETKETIYKALELDEGEKEFLESNPTMFYYQDGENMNLEISIPIKMDDGGPVSREFLKEYASNISDENIFMLARCAEAIYNYEHPEKAQQELKEFNDSMADYSNKWRKEAVKKRTDTLHNQYDLSLYEFLSKKIDNGETTITSSELMENVSPKFKNSMTAMKVKKLCEMGIFEKENDGKKRIFKINKEKIEDLKIKGTM